MPVIPFEKLLVLSPYVDTAFRRFYDEMLSDKVFAVFFSGPDAIQSLIKRQAKNFIDSLADDSDAFKDRFVRIGLLHYELKIPYIDFIKGTSLLKEAFVKEAFDEVASNKETYSSMVSLLYEYFRISLSFMSKGYLNAMISKDKKDIGSLINQYQLITGDEQQLALAQLEWLYDVLIDVEQGAETRSSDLENKSEEIHQKLLKIIAQHDISKIVQVENVEDLHQRLVHDTESLFYFLGKGHYTDILPIYTGLLSVYKISLFLISNFVVSSRLEETRKKLKGAEKNYQQLMVNTSDAIFLTGLNHQITFTNPVTQDIFGYSPEEFVADSGLLTRIAHPDYREKFAAYLERFATKAPPSEKPREWAWIHKEGKTVFTENHSTKIHDEDRRLIGYQIIVRDVTERKQAELAMEQAKNTAEAANSAKSIFLANMSHELRTPLNSVLGFSQLMQTDKNLSDQQRNHLNIINRSGRHLLDLINNVLDMSRIEAGKTILELTDINLTTQIQDVVDMMRIKAKEKRLTLTCTLFPDFPEFVRADGGKIRQILINLLSNAIKFTDQGSVTLRLTSMNDPSGAISLRGEVEDTGQGIGPEHLETVFQPFEYQIKSSEQTGTGLGLAITRQYVELMGGEISVESELGKGSTFYFTAIIEPANQENIKVREQQITREVIGLKEPQLEWRILIAEDQFESQLVLKLLLERAGFKVLAVNEGEKAVQAFLDWHPHFIWMDRQMPRMDGLAAIQRIRELPGGEKVKIATLTASAFKTQRDEVTAAGSDDFVSKPYRNYEIFDCMARHLNVHYIYEEKRIPESSPVTTVTRDMMAVLPPELGEALRNAAVELDIDQSQEVLVRIAETQPELADGLSHLVQKFDFSTIKKLLDPADV
jgi:PAS domain S-box-containing protein